MVPKNITFKRLANDRVPESCRAGGNTCLEALTGLCECQVLSPEKFNPDVHAVRRRAWGQHLCDRKGEIAKDLAGSETLSERTRNNLRENREILCLANAAKADRVRIENPSGVRRW
jgi:hypothetical protein